MALPLLLVGCAAPQPDVPGEAAQLTGIENAIAFRNEAEPMDWPPLPNGALSREQAVRLGLSHDPRIQSSLAKVRVAEADANQARLLPNPILTLDARWPIQSGSNFAIEPSLSIDLIAILQKPTLISAADQRLREAAANALVTVLDVISEIEQAYVSARLVDDEIANAERRLQRLQRLRDLARKRLEAGEGTRLDRLTIDGQWMQASLDLSDLRLQREEERLLLARLLNQPRSAANWELEAPDVPTQRELVPESDWIAAALANRPEVVSKVWELRSLGADLKLTNLAPLQGGELGVHAEKDPQWRIGPVWTTPVPIFDWGQAQRAKVRAEIAGARHDLAEQQLEIVQGVRTAYIDYIHSRRNLAYAQDQILPLQQQQLDQAQLAYQAGEADVTILLLAENEFDQTLSKIVELREKVSVARIKLQRAAGGAAVAERTDGAIPVHLPPTTGPAASQLLAAPATGPTDSTRPSTEPTTSPATGTEP
jgi:cobalt-zinc-cadmium efflux system outer membrane protein